MPSLSHRRLLALVSVPLILALHACSDSSEPVQVDAIRLIGPGPSGVVDQTISLQFLILDEAGAGLGGVPISFSVSDGVATPESPTSDRNGMAAVQWHLGTESGTQTLTATAEGATASVDIEVSAGPAARVTTSLATTFQGEVGADATVVVTVRDSFGNAKSGALVRFEIAEGDGSLSPGQIASDRDGNARTTWTLGPRPGTQRLVATSPGVGSVTFSATALPGPPTNLQKVSGDSQTGVEGQTLSAPVVVELTDRFGNPTPGATVTFRPRPGDGTVASTSVQADANGRASTVWTLGTSVGKQFLDVTAGRSVAEAVFSASTPSSFDIEIRFIGSSPPTDFQIATVEAAKLRWEEVVVGDLPALRVSSTESVCSQNQPSFEEVVDDLLVFVEFQEIDGPGGFLAGGGPCGFRADGSGLPVLGTLRVDVDDVERVEELGEGLLLTVVLHEIGHVLGLGPLWDVNGLVTGFGTADPRYTGAGSVAQYRQLGGTAETVPLEDDNVPGAASVHWEEEPGRGGLDTELMTGFLDVGAPLSTITVASLQDLGYVVDLAAADAFSVPRETSSASEASPPHGRLHLGNDVIRPNPVRVNADGSLTILPRR